MAFCSYFVCTSVRSKLATITMVHMITLHTHDGRYGSSSCSAIARSGVSGDGRNRSGDGRNRSGDDIMRNGDATSHPVIAISLALCHFLYYLSPFSYGYSYSYSYSYSITHYILDFRCI